MRFLMQYTLYCEDKRQVNACENRSTGVDEPHELFPWAKFILIHKLREVGWGGFIYGDSFVQNFISFPNLIKSKEGSFFRIRVSFQGLHNALF